MRGAFGFLKTTIIGGILFLIPLVVVGVVLAKAYDVMKTVAKPLSRYLATDTVTGVVIADLLALLLVVALCFLAGLLARSTPMRNLAARFERKVLQGVPLYQIVKSTVESMLPLHREQGFQPVLVEFADRSQIGLEVERQASGMVVVYLPGAPNPWSGSVMLFSPARVKALPVTMLHAMQTLQQLGKGANAIIATPNAPPASGT